MNAIQTVLTYTLFLPVLFGCGGGEVKTINNLSTSYDIEDANCLLRKRSGRWESMAGGITHASAARIRAIVAAPDGRIYVAGQFDDAGGETAENIAVWDGSGFAAVQAGVGPNGEVYDLAVDAEGNLYAVGAFTAIDGTTVDYVAKWNGSSWESLGVGGSGADDIISCVAIGPDGLVYVGGQFVGIGGVGSKGIAVWDGSAWAGLDGGVHTGVIPDPVFSVRSIVFDKEGNLYAGGLFEDIGSGPTTVNHVAKWDGATWTALGTGVDDGDGILDNQVMALLVAQNGELYVGGNFTTASGVDANYIAKWNGASWTPLGVGANHPVYEFEMDTDGLLYVAGLFTEIGGLSASDRVAAWNGSTWSNLDIDLPGSPYVYALRFLSGDLYLGFTTSGTATVAGGSLIAEINNEGSADSFPKFIIGRSGGTGARLESIRNLTTGYNLLFDWELLDGETVKIDLMPGNKTISSSVSGNAINKLLVNSDISAWRLVPGTNDIALFIVQAGSPTMTAFIQWQENYLSAGG